MLVFLVRTCRPCCRCCTWPPGTGSGTGGHTASGVPQTRPGTLVLHLDPCSRRDQPGAPCRWCSPGTQNRTDKVSVSSPGLGVSSGSRSWDQVVTTSSGGLLTFCRYFLTTSSGVLPAQGEERQEQGHSVDLLVSAAAQSHAYPYELVSWWFSCSSGPDPALV